ncbi:creatinine amidohydrolase [Bryobacterales bacterium F-183]|nr:creatinine amidohydrolase [Bryobacterales bacterium F-183]
MKRFAELNREELRELAPQSMVVLPIGATEQHGPHLATGMDYFTVESIALEAAAIAGQGISVIVAPALPYGSSHHHLVFGGTLSFTTETYRRMLYELVECLVIDGFKRIFLLNGHGGNQELMQLAVRDIVLTHPVRAAAGSYWNIARQDLIEKAGAEPSRLPGHAGEFETSVMLSLNPALVSKDLPHRDTNPAAKLPSTYRDERHGFWKDINGHTDSPDLATAEKGALYRKVIAEAVAKAWVEFAATTS